LVAAVYEDGGVSGELPMDSRPRGREMLDTLRRSEAEAVIVYTADRLSRNAAHFLVLRDQWQRRGVELHYVDRGKLQDTPEGRLMQTIESGVAEYEREKIRMRTMGGKRDKARAGKWLGVHTPYGYRREGKGREARLYIHEPEAAIIRQIFEWYVRGESHSGALPVSDICRRLEARGILPPQTEKGRSDNTRWSRASVRQMLRNEIYAGYIHYGKERLAPKEYETQSLWERTRPVPPEEWIRVDLPGLALVDLLTFEAAQERAERNRAMANRRRHDYLLSGFLNCGHCGWAMGGVRNTRHKKSGDYVQRFYRCPNPHCPANTKLQVAHALDSLIWSWLLRNTSNEANLKKGLRELGQTRAAELQPKYERLASLDGLIADTEARIKRLVAEFANERDDTALEALRAQRQAAIKNRDALLKEQTLLKAELDRREVHPERQATIFQMARAVGRRMGANPTVNQRRDLLEALEVKVTFWRLEEKRRALLDWAIGKGAALYLGDEGPCLSSIDWAPCNPRRRAR
jgi:DNA invertase Pin-like site-specific DNA recombinase